MNLLPERIAASRLLKGVSDVSNHSSNTAGWTLLDDSFSALKTVTERVNTSVPKLSPVTQHYQPIITAAGMACNVNTYINNLDTALAVLMGILNSSN